MSQREALDANIPKDVVSTRSQSGKNLSYLETWYVIDRMNQVIGTENWSHEVISLQNIPGDKISYVCQVRITANIDGAISFKDGLGYGSDKGSYNPGEMASKEAESDALKRAAMKFGRSLGLALYDKSQEFVGEEIKDTIAVVKHMVSTNGNKPDSKPISKHPEVSSPASAPVAVLRGQIKSAFSVLQAQKKVTKEDFVRDYLKGAKADDLNDVDARIVILLIQKNFPEIKL